MGVKDAENLDERYAKEGTKDKRTRVSNAPDNVYICDSA